MKDADAIFKQLFKDIKEETKIKILQYFSDSIQKSGPIPQLRIKKFLEQYPEIYSEIVQFINKNQYIKTQSLFLYYFLRKNFYTCKKCRKFVKILVKI